MKKGQAEMVILIGTILIILVNIGVSYYLLAPFLSASSDITAKNLALTLDTAAAAPELLETNFVLPTKSPLALPQGLQEYNFLINTLYFKQDTSTSPYLACASEELIDCDAYSYLGQLASKVRRGTFCYMVHIPTDSTSTPRLTFDKYTHTLEITPSEELDTYSQISFIKISSDAQDLEITSPAEETEELTCY